MRIFWDQKKVKKYLQRELEYFKSIFDANKKVNGKRLNKWADALIEYYPKNKHDSDYMEVNKLKHFLGSARSTSDYIDELIIIADRILNRY